MSGNLTALVDQLVHLSNTQAPPAAAPGTFGPGPMDEALRHAWAGEPKKALAAASALLTDDPDSPRRFEAYRLWIESLADQRERAALKALRDHLFLRGQAAPADQATYAALRGLVHFELDEMGAARLLAGAMTDREDNPYCLELVQRVEGRVAAPPVPALLRCTSPLTDYCHWQTLARGLLLAGADEALTSALEFVRDHFRAATLPQLFEFHRCIDQSFYAAAALVAARLTELYPSNVDFRYFQAYALFEDGDYPAARRLLNDALRLAGDSDAELLGLLGHCNAKLGDPAKAASLLKRAVSLLAAEGLPTSHISLELATVEDELRGDQLDPALVLPRQTRKWLVNLSPRRYHEFVTSSESAVDRLLRPMGREPSTGDICFFATTTRRGAQTQWKIVGIYAVDSEPMWHPTRRFHSALKLITRLPVGIPVDVESAADDVEAGAPVERDAAINFGVYELDNQAIDIIEQAVRLSRDEMIERRSGGSQSRRPTA